MLDNLLLVLSIVTSCSSARSGIASVSFHVAQAVGFACRLQEIFLSPWAFADRKSNMQYMRTVLVSAEPE